MFKKLLMISSVVLATTAPVQAEQCQGLLGRLFGIQTFSCEQRRAMVHAGTAMVRTAQPPVVVNPFPQPLQPMQAPRRPITVIRENGDPVFFVPLN